MVAPVSRSRRGQLSSPDGNGIEWTSTIFHSPSPTLELEFHADRL
jgi:hypothetical protein